MIIWRSYLEINLFFLILYDECKKLKEVITTIAEDYYKKIINGTYNRQKDYIKKNKVRKYKNYSLNLSSFTFFQMR